MEYYVRVAVQGYAVAKITANSDAEALEKALELEEEDFVLDKDNIDYDTSDKYREVYDSNGKCLKF